MLHMDRNTVEKLFADFANLKVLVIGDVMIDSYIWGKVDRISPEAPVPVVLVENRENRLGGAANVALNVQSLGAMPIMCSVVGTDQKANEFVQLLEDKNISSVGIVKSPKRITTTKFRIIGNNYQMLRVDEEDAHALSSAENELFITRIKQLIICENPAVIIFEDYDKGVISESLIKQIVDFATANHIPVVVDPKKKNFLHYENVSLFKPNFKELCEGLKIENISKDQENLNKICSALQKANNIETILLTMSEHGVYVSKLDSNNMVNSEIIPAQIRNIADVSGAGDTVISIAGLCLALKLDAHDIAYISNIGGGLVCEAVGVVPINKDLLKNELLSVI
ncbi:MAG: bifunctional ADP-heptose synthase [Bacteroidota bacterium]